MTAYSGFHFQKPINDWPRAAAILPNGTWIKAIDNVQMLDEAKRVNPGVKTVLRHFDGGWHQFNKGTLSAYKEHARAFFNTFIDGTFMNFAHNVDGIEGLNEFNAASHNTAEVAERAMWVQASCIVWANEFRTRAGLGHIRLVSSNTAVGNDIPLEAARAIADYGAIASYHPYIPTQNNQIRADEWRWYSGRWTEMDKRFRAAGITVKWLFTEAGPIGYTGDHLLANDGWRHENVCGANVNSMLQVVKYWMDKTALWNYEHGGRALGQVLYNSGGADNEWKLFEIAQPNMDAVAAFNRDYVPPKQPTPSPPPPPEPEPDPEPDPRRYVKKAHVVAPGIRRRLFDAVVDEAWQNKESVFFSVDDAALTARTDLVEITARTLIFWNVEQILSRPEEEAKAALEDFIETYYPEPTPTMVYRRLGKLFTADSWDFPLGDEEQRGRVQVPPEPYFDANPFLNHYFLGYHTGNDYNLPGDLDRNGPVYAAAAGKVVYASQPSVAWQNVIIIRHQLPDGSYVYSRSAHLHEMFVKPEEWLKRGEMIGTTGRNWDSDNGRWGPWHLHYDVSPTSILPKQPGHWPGENRAEVVKHYVDPINFIRQHR